MTISNHPTYYDPSRIWISIVGMGAGGARVFREFIDQISVNSFYRDKVGFVLFDARNQSNWGRGVAWGNKQSELFLANMRFDKLGLPSSAEGFIKSALGIEGEWDDNEIPENIQFVSRVNIGQALHIEFEQSLMRANQLGIPVHAVYENAEDIYASGRSYVLSAGKNRIACDIVVLALGNIPKRIFSQFEEHDNFISNPWDFESYRNSLKDKRVGIIGLGPTAIDVVVLANEQGAREIHAASRNGRMQHPRPKNSEYSLRLMTHERVKSIIDQRRQTGRDMTFADLWLWLESEFNFDAHIDNNEARRYRLISLLGHFFLMIPYKGFYPQATAALSLLVGRPYQS